MSNDTTWLDWVDPLDNKQKYLALSEDTGHYWTEDTSDPLIVDVTELEVRFSVEDTLLQLSEKWRLAKGRQYERHNLFRHPDPKVHAWLAVEKRPSGERDPETKKVIRTYQAYWTRRFKSVAALSIHTGRAQGNPLFTKGSKEAKLANEKSRLAKKKRLANATEVAHQLQFDPLKRLALYALGDSASLGLKEDVKPNLQVKALETYLRYSHAQIKPFSPHEIEAMKKGDNGPRINVILPADGSEIKGTVLEHKDEKSLQDYLAKGSVGSYDDIESELEDYDEGFKQEYARLELPDEDV